MTTKVITGLATSLDGFVAGADDSPAPPLGVGGERLFDWFRDGDTPSRFYEWMRMSAHHVPGTVPAGVPPYTFISGGVEEAVARKPGGPPRGKV